MDIASTSLISGIMIGLCIAVILVNLEDYVGSKRASKRAQTVGLCAIGQREEGGDPREIPPTSSRIIRRGLGGEASIATYPHRAEKDFINALQRYIRAREEESRANPATKPPGVFADSEMQTLQVVQPQANLAGLKNPVVAKTPRHPASQLPNL